VVGEAAAKVDFAVSIHHVEVVREVPFVENPFLAVLIIDFYPVLFIFHTVDVIIEN
jgi:hypothetical protein